MLGVVFTSSLRDFLRPSRVVIWVVVSVVVGLISRVWIRMGSVGDLDVAFGQIVTDVVFRFVALAAALFVPMVLSQEVAQKTIIYWLTRAVPRPVMLVGRTLAAFAATSFVGVVVAVCVGVGVLGPGFLGHSTFLPDLFLTVVGAAAYCAIFVMISLLVNKALVWCLLFAFGWETFVPNMPGMAALAVHTHLANLQADTKPSPATDEFSDAVQRLVAVDVAPAVSWAVLIGTALVVMALACWWFSRKEFAPREDAE